MAIKDLAQWRGSNEVFGYINSDPGQKVDYIYEFYCGMCLLKDLSKQHKIVPVKRGGKLSFPKKPGNKLLYSYFNICVKAGKTVLNQFCFGTEIAISTSPQTTFSSDLSVQISGASDTPDENEVVIILDAKYKSNKANKLDISTIREFAKCVSDMNTPKTTKNKLLFTNYKDLNGNCLITNGQVINKHKQYCKNNKIKQIGNFDFDEAYEVVG